MKHVRHWDAIHKQHVAVREFVTWLQEEYDIRLDWGYAKDETPLDFGTLVDQFFGVNRVGLEEDRRALLEFARNPKLPPPPIDGGLKVKLATAFIDSRGLRFAAVHIIHPVRNVIADVHFDQRQHSRILVIPSLKKRRDQVIRICRNFLAAEEANGPIYRNFKKDEPAYV